MVAVELLVVGGLFVVVVRGADGRAGGLVGPVGEDEDLACQAGLDDAVGAGRGEVVGTSRRPGAQETRMSKVSSTYRQAVARDIPKPAPSWENVSFFRRWTRVSNACLKQPSLRQRAEWNH